jgi:hypothetical protein
VSRCKLLIDSPDLAIDANAVQEGSEGLLALHTQVVQLQQSISARCDPAMDRVRALVAEQQLRTTFIEYQGRMMQAVGYGADGAAAGGSPGGQGMPGNNGAGLASGSPMNFGFGHRSGPRVDTPMTLPPEPYTGETNDGVKQDAKNFLSDVVAYILDSPAHQSDAKKVRFLINYFLGQFSNEW